jgi:hypothetical protein
MSRALRFSFLLFVGFGFFFTSCKKEDFIKSGDAQLSTSTDSLKYDTIFTTTGSVTQSFKIFNNNSKKLLLSSIKLMGGNNSPFNLNINGVAGSEQHDIEIAAGDSIYVFCTVNINPSTDSLPFVVQDSILISYNGNNRFVQLEAFGQNAHFLNNYTIERNETWSNDLPYVIIGNLHIDTTALLSIEQGCKIYLHANATILVDGTLHTNGIKNNEVVFSGDRLDEYYRDLPGSWPGIYFSPVSKDNELNFAVIKNANNAIKIEQPSVNGNPKLTLHQCIIDNALQAGIFSLNSSIVADNTLISNCGSNIFIELGGNYDFANCTVATYSNTFFIHNSPVLNVANFTYENGNLISENINAHFTNCIFWGDGGLLSDEVSVAKEGSNTFEVSLQNCLFKSENEPSNTTISSSIKNIEPVFDSIDPGNKYYDFRTTKDGSAPVIDNGALTSFPYDLDNNPRISGVSTDMGCYEKQ